MQTNYNTASLQGAIDAATAGSTLNVLPGVYNGPINAESVNLSGIVSPTTNNIIRHGIDVSGGSNNRPSSFKSGFYNTQGYKMKIDTSENPTKLSVDVFIPQEELTSGRRYAGLWGFGYKGSAIASYPIIEFTSADPADTAVPTTNSFPRFRYYNSVTGGWVNEPTDVQPNKWYTLTIELTGNQGLSYTAADQSSKTVQYYHQTKYSIKSRDGTFNKSYTMVQVNAAMNSYQDIQYFGEVALQGYNLKPEGFTYNIYWQNLTLNTTVRDFKTMPSGTDLFQWQVDRYAPASFTSIEYIPVINGALTNSNNVSVSNIKINSESSGDDLINLSGPSGNLIDLAGGVDTVVYNTSVNNVTISYNGTAFLIKSSSADGDLLVNVEKVQFSDKLVWLVKPGSSIQSAINSATAGDMVFVAAGTFNENILINKPLTLKGAGESTIIKGTIADYTVAIQGASNVTLENFKVRPTANPATDGTFMLHVYSNPQSDNITLRGLVFDGDVNGVPTTRGVSLNHVKDVWIEDCVFPATKNYSLGIASVDGLVVKNSTFSASGWGTIGIFPSQQHPSVPVKKIDLSQGNTFVNGSVTTSPNSGVIQIQPAGSVNISYGFSGAVDVKLPSAFKYVYNYMGSPSVSVTNTRGLYSLTAIQDLLTAPVVALMYGKDLSTGRLFVEPGFKIATAIAAAQANDAIDVAAGTYTEDLTISKKLILQGAKSSHVADANGRLVQTGESVLLNSTITVSSNGSVIKDFGIVRTTNGDVNQLSITNSTAEAVTVENCWLERYTTDPTSPSPSARAIVLSPSSSAIIRNNTFTGQIYPSGTLSVVSRQTWTTAIYRNSGSVLTCEDNMIERCRTALNIDDLTSGESIAINGNTFKQCGTYVSFGGVTATAGSYVFGTNANKPNIFHDPSGAGTTIVNCSNVATSFRLNMTSQNYQEAGSQSPSKFGDLSLNVLHFINASTSHQGRIVSSIVRNGRVIYKANNLYANVAAGLTITNALGYANEGETINLAAGTYTEDLTISKKLTLQGAKSSHVADANGRLVQTGESVLLNSTITVSSNGSVIKDFGIVRTTNGDVNQLSITNSTAEAVTVENCWLERYTTDPTSPSPSARAIVLSPSSSAIIRNNTFTGQIYPSGTLSVVSRQTWTTAIYRNSGSVLTCEDNMIERCRTALNIDDLTSGESIAINGNTFKQCGTYVSFGGVTATAGSYVFGTNANKPNIFHDPSGAGTTIVNCSNVATSFRLNMTSQNYQEAGSQSPSKFGDLSLNVLHFINASTSHQGRIVSSIVRNGRVIYKANNLYANVAAGLTITNALGYANEGETINLAAGTFSENVAISKSLTLKGASKTGTIIQGIYNATNAYPLSVQGVSNVTMENFTVKPDPSGNFMFHAYSSPQSENITLRDLIFDGSANGVPTIRGVSLNHVKGVLIENCDLPATQNYSLGIGGVDGLVVKNSTLRASGWGTVGIFPSQQQPGALVKNIDLSQDNTFVNGTGVGPATSGAIQIQPSTNVPITYGFSGAVDVKLPTAFVNAYKVDSPIALVNNTPVTISGVTWATLTNNREIMRERTVINALALNLSKTYGSNLQNGVTLYEDASYNLVLAASKAVETSTKIIDFGAESAIPTSGWSDQYAILFGSELRVYDANSAVVAHLLGQRVSNPIKIMPGAVSSGVPTSSTVVEVRALSTGSYTIKVAEGSGARTKEWYVTSSSDQLYLDVIVPPSMPIVPASLPSNTSTQGLGGINFVNQPASSSGQSQIQIPGFSSGTISNFSTVIDDPSAPAAAGNIVKSTYDTFTLNPGSAAIVISPAGANTYLVRPSSDASGVVNFVDSTPNTNLVQLILPAGSRQVAVTQPENGELIISFLPDRNPNNNPVVTIAGVGYLVNDNGEIIPTSSGNAGTTIPLTSEKTNGRISIKIPGVRDLVRKVSDVSTTNVQAN